MDWRRCRRFAVYLAEDDLISSWALQTFQDFLGSYQWEAEVKPVAGGLTGTFSWVLPAALSPLHCGSQIDPLIYQRNYWDIRGWWTAPSETSHQHPTPRGNWVTQYRDWFHPSRSSCSWKPALTYPLSTPYFLIKIYQSLGSAAPCGSSDVGLTRASSSQIYKTKDEQLHVNRKYKPSNTWPWRGEAVWTFQLTLTFKTDTPFNESFSINGAKVEIRSWNMHLPRHRSSIDCTGVGDPLTVWLIVYLLLPAALSSSALGGPVLRSSKWDV